MLKLFSNYRILNKTLYNCRCISYVNWLSSGTDNLPKLHQSRKEELKSVNFQQVRFKYNKKSSKQDEVV